MKREDDISDELASWGSPLASMSRETPYSAPDNYFANLPDDIRKNVKNSEAADPNVNWNKETPFQAPQGYFAALPEQVLAHAKENEDRLNLGRTNTYAVPQDYFEALPQQILAAAKKRENEKKTTIIPLGNNLWRFARMAAVAMLVMGIGFGSYEYLVNSKTPNPEMALAKIPENVLKDYAQQNIDDLDVYMNANNLESESKAEQYTQHLNPQEIEQYLDETGG